MSRLRPSSPLRSLACLRPANEQSPLRGEYRTLSLTPALRRKRIMASAYGRVEVGS
jgi:hypothetical protein